MCGSDKYFTTRPVSTNMSNHEDGCGYVFDPEEWEATHETAAQLPEKELDEGVWQCPHAAVEDRECCLFHLPPGEKDSDRVTAAFLDRVQDAGKRPKQFVGARFGSLSLEHVILESTDNHPIDLRHARIDGDLDWRYAIVRQPISFDGAIFRGATRFEEITFEGDAFFSGM